MLNQASRAEAPREPTLTERLNRTNDLLQATLERLSNVLGRINGIQQAARESHADKITAIRPALSMSDSIQQIEGAHAHLSDLTNNFERVA